MNLKCKVIFNIKIIKILIIYVVIDFNFKNIKKIWMDFFKKCIHNELSK
jgi:hypothetical protein